MPDLWRLLGWLREALEELKPVGRERDRLRAVHSAPERKTKAANKVSQDG
jgi:hypothetical protein